MLQATKHMHRRACSRASAALKLGAPARVGVHAGGGFVEEDDGGVPQERNGHAQLAALPARKLLGP